MLGYLFFVGPSDKNTAWTTSRPARSKLGADDWTQVRPYDGHDARDHRAPGRSRLRALRLNDFKPG